ncbi:tail fiber domain-containing protein [Rubinisphaera italica]|uniref:Peptidase S74 domain-containing protein n=1 Tax=Rubinisphaera italica TaxID=2527969 RepID=A0A5C5XEE9_9PLAN|nr:hypothetical protein Pan54_22220 [Rubinisphaera italica]
MLLFGPLCTLINESKSHIYESCCNKLSFLVGLLHSPLLQPRLKKLRSCCFCLGFRFLHSLMSNQSGDGNTSLDMNTLQFKKASSNTAVGAYTLRINSMISSSLRYKEDIQDLNLSNANELLHKLRTVTFRYKKLFRMDRSRFRMA